MRYGELHDRLLRLEALVPAISPARSISDCVRVKDSQIQTYGLSESTKTIFATLPVVVAVGINYTQGDMLCPRKVKSQIKVEDKLSTCQRFLKTAFSDGYRKYRDIWKKHQAASSSCLNPPGDFHLVMTNFCLWITKVRWMKLKEQERSDLLKNNPLFDGRSTEAPHWLHLQRLHDTLADEPEVLWVAHGMKSEVFRLFDEFKNYIAPRPWLKVPNLSYPYCGKGGSHYDRCFPRDE